MKRFKLMLLLIWFSFISMISPIWIGCIYMDITGHGKGYAYDMGSEADVAIAFGVISLILWISAVFPAFFCLCKRFFLYKRSFVFLPVLGFIVLFCVGILIIGWDEFIRFFGFGYTF